MTTLCLTSTTCTMNCKNKQLTVDQFAVKDQIKKVSDARKSNSKRATINERDKDHDDDDGGGDDAQQQPTPQYYTTFK